MVLTYVKVPVVIPNIPNINLLTNHTDVILMSSGLHWFYFLTGGDGIKMQRRCLALQQGVLTVTSPNHCLTISFKFLFKKKKNNFF